MGEECISVLSCTQEGGTLVTCITRRVAEDSQVMNISLLLNLLFDYFSTK